VKGTHRPFPGELGEADRLAAFGTDPDKTRRSSRRIDSRQGGAGPTPRSTPFDNTSWLDHQAYYRAGFGGAAFDNPDQRIGEDLGLFVAYTLDMTLGLLSSAVTLVSFIAILAWTAPPSPACRPGPGHGWAQAA